MSTAEKVGVRALFDSEDAIPWIILAVVGVGFTVWVLFSGPL